MARTTYHGAVTVSDSASGSDIINLEGDDCVIVEVPTGSSITSLTVHANVRPPGSETFLPLYDGTGQGGQGNSPAAVVQTVAAGRVYVLVTDVNGVAQIKLVGDAAGTVWVSTKRMSQS